jgi:GNAT superfamily N-acetyltransferase
LPTIEEVDMTFQIHQQADIDHPSARPAAPTRWYPVRALGPRQRANILTHLLALEESDRYMRFGYAASDAHIGRYVEQIDFDHDEVFGVFNRRLQLLAMAHLAFTKSTQPAPACAEFGVSVLPRGRGRGIGSRLFESACLRARNRGVDALVVHALTENKPMLKIAKAAGAILERDGPDATARLRLPPEDLSSHLSQLLELQTGEFDFGVKSHAMHMDAFFQAVRRLVPGL